MKVLLSAYACEPGRGSEPGVGWNTGMEVAKYHQVWVFTSNTHRPAIEAELARNKLPNLNFIYLDPLGWIYDWAYEGKRSQWGVYLHYYLWQIWAYFVARPLHRQIGFDLVHHVTYGKYTSPSFFAFLPIPFIWGPVGGGESAPKGFWHNFSLRARVYETLRSLARWLGEQDPFVRFTARRSTLAIVTTSETAERVSALGAKRLEFVSGQTGINQQELAQLGKLGALSRDKDSIRFVSIGRLLHWKGFHLGLSAFAQASLEKGEYWIIGDGPERESLETLASEIGVAGRTRFVGSLSREETFRVLGESHVLFHPSLHDFSPTVCLEAMAAGRPVVCLELGGPSVQVTEETGIKVLAHTPEQMVHDLARAMVCLAEDPELRISMGQAGQKRVREAYSWEAKGQLLSQLYEEVLKLQQTFGSV